MGVKWDTVNDTLSLARCLTVNMHSALTKREILSLLATVFDPLGYFQPALLKAKLFLAKLWQLKYGWDQPLDQELCLDWQRIVDNLYYIFFCATSTLCCICTL